MKYEAVIGLEIHTQLLTDTKMFCRCSSSFGDYPNTNTCPTCLGLPGAMPAANEKAVQMATSIALALNCQINETSGFSRKNYFYPDLPKGYQITQYRRPLAQHGRISVNNNSIEITRVHLEEDAGKSFHKETQNSSLIDFNRSGVPLVEIVSAPQIDSATHAAEYAKAVRQILIYLEVCDGNLQNGSIRIDCNLSLRKTGEKELGTKVELKNLNSFNHMRAALEYEIKRQTQKLDAGGKIVHQTRQWLEKEKRTYPMRDKEQAHDYRYFPEPDLPDLQLPKTMIDHLKSKLPELPEQRKNRFVKELKLPQYDAGILTQTRVRADYFEEIVKQFNSPKTVANFLMEHSLRLDKQICATDVANLLLLVKNEVISSTMAHKVFDKMVQTGHKPMAIVKADGLEQISDQEAINQVCTWVIEAHEEQFEKLKNGQTKLLGFFMGEAMKATNGKANPQKVNATLRRLIDE